jgi:DNA-binding NarL/FixJ family response regulator
LPILTCVKDVKCFGFFQLAIGYAVCFFKLSALAFSVKDMQKKVIRVLIIESHEIIRLGLRAFVESQPLLEIVEETDCFEDALNLIPQHKPDVILLDLLVINGNCSEHINHLLNICLQSKILIYSNANQEQDHLYLLGLGISGIIAKHQTTELLLKAIHAVNGGQVWFNKELTKLLWQTQIATPSSSHIDATQTAQQCLSKHESNIACLASKGLSAKIIAEQLFISEKTVRNKLTIIYQKLGINGQVDLCMKASQLGFNLPN